VFIWEPFLFASTIDKFLKSVHELNDLMIILIARHQESSRSTIEHSVTSLQRQLITLIVLLEGSDEASLGDEASDDLEMVEDKGLGLMLKALVYLVITLKS